MPSNLLLSCPFVQWSTLHTIVTGTTVMVAGAAIVFLIWIALQDQLIVLAKGKKSLHRIIILTFLIPYLNLLWIPWALISSIGYIKSILSKYYKVNALSAGLGAETLAIPLLVLYVFWTTIAYIMWGSLGKIHYQPEDVMYITVVIVCILIVFAFYLVYLSLFVTKVKKHVASILKKKNV